MGRKKVSDPAEFSSSGKPKTSKRQATIDRINAELTEKAIDLKPRIFEPTPELLKEIQLLSLRGLEQDQIARYLGVDRTTFRDRMAEYPLIDSAIRKGRATGISIAGGKLMELVQKGNLSAIIFYLKCKGNFSEQNSLPDDDTNKSKLASLTLTVQDPVEAAKIYQRIMLET